MTIRKTNNTQTTININYNMTNKISLLIGTMALSGVLTASAQQEVPYLTSFDNTYKEYDGTSYLPIGWMMAGDNPFYTANTNELKAATGTYYLISTDNTANRRNEHLYSPLFTLEGGKTYEISYQLYMPGMDYAYLDANGHYAEAYHHPSHLLTVGEEQDYEFHTLRPALLSIEGSNTIEGCATALPKAWVEQKVQWTPEESGNYCFCMAFESDDVHYGDIAIDDFMVTYDGAKLMPTVTFSHGGVFNLMSYPPTVMSYAGGGVPFTSETTHVDDYAWTVTDKATSEVVLTSDEPNPTFDFPASGTYDVVLTGSNDAYDETASMEVKVQRVGSEGHGMTPLYTWGETVTDIYKPNTTPVIGLDDPQDFASGPNHTYRVFAERFEFPETTTLTLTTLQYFLSQCSFASMTSGSASELPFTLAIYGETDGQPDETKVIWRKELKMSDAFTTNTAGLGAATQMARSLENATVTGTFYVAFEYDEEFSVDVLPSGSRHVMELTTCQHHDGIARMHYKDRKTGEWHRLDYFNPGLGGLGLNLVLWCSAAVKEPEPPLEDGITLPSLAPFTQQSYDLSGRRVTDGAHGIVILNGGRKVVK